MNDSTIKIPDDDHPEDDVDNWDGWDYGMNLANQVDENED